MRPFSIPLNREDLVTTSSNFFVENQYNIRELKAKLKDLDVQAQHTGWDCITGGGGFDVLFSVLQQFHKDLPADYKETAFYILERLMRDLLRRLETLLVAGADEPPDAHAKALHRNKLRMIVWLFCQLIELIEEGESKVDPLAAMKGTARKGGRAKAAPKMDDFTWNWDAERMQAVIMLTRMLQINISVLFDPPIADVELITAVANVCFRMLENPASARAANKDGRLAIAQALGTLNQRYNYSLPYSLKIVQELKHFEHITVPLAEATEICAKEFNGRGLVMDVVREIGQLDARELSRDTSGTRAYAEYIVELSKRVPQLLKPCLSLLVAHLDGESYNMRKSILTALGEIILRVLTRDAQNESNKDDRDQFLEYLEDHLHDVHAYVRSSVLQVWNRLCAERAIPLTRQHAVLDLVVGRLSDKSMNVRKQAMQALTTFLQCNPYGAHLSVKDLQDELDKETKTLDELVKADGDRTQEREKIWAEAQESLLAEIRADNVHEGSGASTTVWENAASGEVSQRVRRFLERKEWRKAVQLFRAAGRAFPDDDVFAVAAADARGDDDADDAPTVLAKLKAVFDDAAAPEPPTLTQPSQQPVGVGGAVDGGVGAGAAPIGGGQPQGSLARQKNIVEYLRNAVRFTQLVQNGLLVVCQLLGSKGLTDVLEAINFFVSAFEFGLLDAMLGIRQMPALVWSRETSIRDAVVEAYRRLYITPPAGARGAAAAATHIVKNLIALVSGATIGELTSLEELIGMLVRNKDIDKDCFTVAWKYFTRSSSDVSEEDARSALVLLGMFAASKPEIIASNVPVVVDHGIDERSFKLTHDACNALLKIVPPKPSQESHEPPLKLEADHVLFARLEQILVDGIHKREDQLYVPMANRAVQVIFSLCDRTPDVLAGRVIKRICNAIHDKVDPSGGGGGDVPAFLLQRLLSLVGQVALCVLTYLDVAVYNEMKRQRWVRDSKKESLRKKKSLKKSRRSAASERETPRSQSTPEDPDDMGVAGAEADDADAEFIKSVTEAKVVTGGNLLSLFAPVLTQICSNPSRYAESTDLLSAASLALGKFMLVSENFCEANLQVLFTLLEKSPEPTIRANIIIAAGDLSFRFPNTLEPWSPHMYARLGDESAAVRSNTLTVLTHLILNDMIKVKGYISEMAKCLVDEVEKISNLAKLFFTELSRKGNQLYNVMPDIISRLSDVKSGVEEEVFRDIMKFIINLIEKDKQLESLVEKLCHRFRGTLAERNWRDLAFCLSLFSYSDKAVKKLLDNFGCFGDKLHEPFVWDALSSIVVAAQKLPKAETKLIVDELSAKMSEAHDKGVEDDTANKRAAAAAATKSKQAAAAATKRKSAAAAAVRKTRDESSDESSDDDAAAAAAEAEAETAPAQKGERRVSLRQQKAAAAAAAVEAAEPEDDDEDEEEDEEGDGDDEDDGEGEGDGDGTAKKRPASKSPGIHTNKKEKHNQGQKRVVAADPPPATPAAEEEKQLPKRSTRTRR